MPKKILDYYSKHPHYNSVTHVLGGVGIGMLLVYPIFNGHTVRFGLIFLGLSLALHAYPFFHGKK